MSHVKEEPSLKELLSNFSNEVQFLFSRELQLAKTELTEKLTMLLKGTVSVWAGGMVLYAGLLALLAAAVAGLAATMPVWLASLIVGGAVVITGAALLAYGISRFKKERLKPQQTIESIKEDKEWLKRQK